MTTSERFQTFGKSVFATWAKRCDFFYFLTTGPIEDIPTIIVDVPEQRAHVWEKLR